MHVYHGSPQPRWQGRDAGSGLCCREKFGKFLTWAEPEPKRRFFALPYTAYTGKVLLQTKLASNNQSIDQRNRQTLHAARPLYPHLKYRKRIDGNKLSNANENINSLAEAQLGAVE